MDLVISTNSIRSFTSQAYKEGNQSRIRDSCVTFEFRSKIDSQQETSLRRSLLSNSSSGKRMCMSQRKSRFSQMSYQP